MFQKRKHRHALYAALALSLTLVSGSARGANITLQGTIGADDAVQLFNLTVATAGSVDLRSYGYAGGITSTGTVVPSGGFDPILTLFSASGAFLNENDDGAGVATDPSTGLAGDARLTQNLAAGSYILALTQYDNFSLGNLADGFVDTGYPNFTADPSFTVGGSCFGNMFRDASGTAGRCRNGNWTVDFGNVASVTPVASTPEPSALQLACLGLALLLISRRTIRNLLVLCLSALTLSAQSTTYRAGAIDPAGNPQNLTLFRDQQVFVMSPGTKATPWQTNIVDFDSKLNPTGTVSQLPWSGDIPFTQQAIQAVAGRFLTPDKDDIALVQRSESNPADLVLRFRDGSLPTTLSSSFAPRLPSWSDLFATSAGELDRLYDAQGNYHDEVAVAWIEMEPYLDSTVAVPHVAVVNYNDPTHPTVLSQRLNRDDEQYAFSFWLTNYDSYVNQQYISGITVSALQPNDNVVATAIGDFDGDGFNELAVAYMRGQDGIVISIVIYRYQNDGTQASLTPVNTFEINNQNVGKVGTLSLAAGDFDGSGFDQLMVGSAYWSGTPDDNGNPKEGTLNTQPVVFLVKGGQVSGTVSSAASAGAGTATTNVTVSLGQGAYVPQTVTISGAIGSWAAINGTWQVTPTASGFSLPIDSSQFAPFDGQNVQVNVAAPLAQADTMLLDAFPSLPGYSPGPIHIDDADRDGRIRVQMVAGLFHFDPSNGFDYTRRQVAMAWNARPAPSQNSLAAEDGDSHLALLQVINGKIVLAYAGNGILKGFQTFQTLALAGGAFRGDNNTNDPTWSLFLSGVGQAYNNVIPGTDNSAEGVVNTVLNVAPDSKDNTKLTVSPVCYGKASGDPHPPTYYGFTPDNPPVCQIWGSDARMESPTGPYPFPANNEMRLPAIAADLNGNSLKLGAPIHAEVFVPGKSDFILEQPPQHVGWLDLGNGPTIVNISRYPTFNTHMVDSTNTTLNFKSTGHVNWNVGGSAQFTASNTISVGVKSNFLGADLDTTTKTTQKFSVKVAYDRDQKTKNYNSHYSAITVGKGEETGTDDALILEGQLFDIWRYRIYGSDTDTGDPTKPNLFYEMVLPGPTVVSLLGGLDTDWYQPIHEVGNVLSYPDTNDACNPSDLGPITVPNTEISNTVRPLIPCTQVSYGGNTTTLNLDIDYGTGSGTTTSFANKMQADVDLSYTSKTTVAAGGTGTVNKFGLDVDLHGGADWGTTTVNDDKTSSATGIVLNSPQGDSNHAYSYWPIVYNTTAGGLKVAYGVGDLGASADGGLFWKSFYAQKPDPGLNLPSRFVAVYSGSSNVLTGWATQTSIVRKKMKGFVLRQPTTNPLTNEYPLLGSNPAEGDTVLLDVRVYNFSLSADLTSPFQVKVYAIPYDSVTNNEICPGIPATGAGGRVCPASARRFIGIASTQVGGGTQTFKLSARQQVHAYYLWNIENLGPTGGAGVQDYRVYIVLDSGSDPSVELNPPEAPCTQMPCEDNGGNELIVDPGQNNEGWSLIAVGPPNRDLLGGIEKDSLSSITKTELSAVGPATSATALATAGASNPKATNDQLIAYLHRPLHLRITAFSNVESKLWSHATVYDLGASKTAPTPETLAELQAIAGKFVLGTQPQGSSVWFDWTPTRQGIHHLYATIQNFGGIQTVGEVYVLVRTAPGDLNGDGRVDRHDLNMLQRDLGKAVADSACGEKCDLDGDGTITQKDANLMVPLCDSQSCAFATAEYVGGPSPSEPDMREVRQSEKAAIAAFSAQDSQGTQLLSDLAAQPKESHLYETELKSKESLRTIRYYYRGQPVTTGPHALKNTAVAQH